MGWIVPPPYISLESINITPFGKRVFTNENKNLEMTSSWIKVGPKSNDKSLEKRTGNAHKAEAIHGRMEAEVSSVIYKPRNSRIARAMETRRIMNRSPWEPPEGSNPADVLISDFCSQTEATQYVVICYYCPKNLIHVSHRTPLKYNCTLGCLFW